MYIIKLENTVTHQTFRYESEDMNRGNKLYLVVNINTLELEDGEYILTLCDSEDNVLSSDILRIGDFEPKTIQYKAGENTYISIDLDAKLGTKEAQITDIITTVYADEGYDGMTEVKIDASIVYDNGRNDGYNEGKVDGIIEQKSKLETITISENGTYEREDGYSVITVDVPDLNGSYDDGYNQGITEGYPRGFEEGYNLGKTEVIDYAQEITITENGQYGDGETLYKTIDVNVVPKVEVAKSGMKFGNSTFTEVPDWADFNGITDLYYMFNECGNLKRIPTIDTSQVTEMNYTFKSCSNLETIPLLDTSKVTIMDSTFWGCEKLSNFPPIDTSSVTQIVNAFNGCYALTTLPALNMQSLNMWSFFGIFGYNELPNLINFGGFLNLKQSLTDDKGFKKLPNLTYESCINVLNGLYDFVAAGETPNSEQGQLKVHQNFLNTVGDEISIGTNKGWIISA